jgi:hypothetical protein
MMAEPTVATKQMIEELFDAAAGAYDRTGPSVFTEFGARLVEQLPIGAGARAGHRHRQGRRAVARRAARGRRGLLTKSAVIVTSQRARAVSFAQLLAGLPPV